MLWDDSTQHWPQEEVRTHGPCEHGFRVPSGCLRNFSESVLDPVCQALFTVDRTLALSITNTNTVQRRRQSGLQQLRNAAAVRSATASGCTVQGRSGRMSVLQWLFIAVVAYFANSAYQSIKQSRKRADFIRDRRRAAGIPDDDKRPFAVARADALSRRTQQRRDEALSTPVKRRLTQSRPQAAIDHEAAARLSGIPGTLPGYLKEHLASDATSTTSARRGYGSSHSATADSPRSPSPIKSRGIEKSSSHVDVEYKQPSRRNSSKVNRIASAELERSPTAQRNRKRTHQASPTKDESAERSANGAHRNKAQKASIPGTFGSDQEVEDEDMSDANQSAAESEADAVEMEAMDEEEGSLPSPANGVRNKSERGSQMQSLGISARATAKKREADELDASDTEQSIDSDGEDDTPVQPHSSKRSRTVNKEVDPTSSLDFDIALPEEAMIDFNPVHDASSTKSKTESSATKIKRLADTSDDRQPGEEWTDFEGLRWRIHPETHELQRWSDVLEWRSKYRMPRDSIHPQAKESHQVIVHKWLSKDEWEDAKAKKLLSFQEPERLAEKERLDKEEAEKMRRKQEVLAKIRQTASPNKRIQSYLVQQQRRQLQHKLSGDVSMNSYLASENGDSGSMSIDTASVGGGEGTPGKPKSKRISLHSRMTPIRGADGSVRASSVGQEGSVSGTSSPTDSPSRRRNSPLASPYRPIQYPKSKKGTPANSSPLVSSTFPPPDSSS